MRNRSTWVALVGFALLATACGGDDAADTTTTVAETVATTTTEAAPDEPTTTAVDAMDNLRAATIRIVANGTFVDPQEGEQANVAGSGSGFIIDESGIAVTNNHVVTGAAFLDVFVDGREEPVIFHSNTSRYRDIIDHGDEEHYLRVVKDDVICLDCGDDESSKVIEIKDEDASFEMDKDKIEYKDSEVKATIDSSGISIKSTDN